MSTLNQPKKLQNKTLRSAERNQSQNQNQKHNILAKPFNKTTSPQIKKQQNPKSK